MQALKLFKTIYQFTPDPEHSYVAWGAVKSPLYFNVAELLEIATDIPQDQDIFFTPGILKEPKRVKAAALGAGVVWVDRDLYKNDVEPLLPPTFRVNSGRGQHLYYVLDNFYRAEDIEKVNKLLLAHLGLPSEGTWDITRFLRVPGSVNQKYKDPQKYPEYAALGPLPCEIVEYNPQYTYSLTDLGKLKPYAGDLLVTPVKDNGLVDQSERDWKLASLLSKDWGLAEYAVRQALDYHSGKARNREAEYVDRIIEKLSEVKPTEGGKEDEDAPLLNAEIEPAARLVSPNGVEIGLNLRVTWGKRGINAAALASDFTTGKSITAWLQKNGAGNRIFTGSDKHAKLLYQMLEARCPEVEQLLVENAGRYDLPEQRVFIYGKSSIISDTETDLGCFWKPQIDIDNKLDLDPSDPNPEDIKNLLALVQQVNLPQVIQPALGWLFMTPFKSLLEGLHFKMPILLLYGFAGSGKSSLIQFGLLPLLGRFTSSVASDSTRFSILGNMTLTHSWPVWFGEFRATNNNAEDFQRLLREMYDLGVEARGRPDQSLASYKLVSPTIVDGENPFTDGATAERTIAVQLSKDTIDKPQHAAAFSELLMVANKTFKQFAHKYLAWSLSVDSEDLHKLLLQGQQQFNRGYTPRVSNNLAVVWSGLTLLKRFVKDQGWDVEINQDRDAFIQAITTTYTPGLGVKTTVDTLAEQVSHFHYLDSMATEWDASNGVLWFNLTRVARALRITTDLSMLRIQLQQRTTAYLIGPERREGGAEFWGIDVFQAQKLGLDVYQPYTADGHLTHLSAEKVLERLNSK